MLCFAGEGENVIRDYILLHEVSNVFERNKIPNIIEKGHADHSASAWKQPLDWNAVQEMMEDRLTSIHAFEVQTSERGFNSGRSYYFRTQTTEQRDAWVDVLKEAVKRAKRRKVAQESSIFRTAQARVREVYDSSAAQGLVALLICSNFVINAAQAEVQPAEGSYEEEVFGYLDTAFTAAFGFELACNLFSHWFWTFFRDGWSVFDLIVVAVSLVSIGVEEVPGLSILRLLRAFRVLRLFGKLASIRRIINALGSAVVPVCNAFLIMFLVTAIYAIMGNSLFGDLDDLYFGTFSRALFTMFQVTTGDQWSDLARGLFQGQPLSWRVCVYFVSFHMIVGWTLLQVVVAVLLDNFSEASDKEKETQRKERSAREGKSVAVTALDPVLACLAHFNTSQVAPPSGV